MEERWRRNFETMVLEMSIILFLVCGRKRSTSEFSFQLKGTYLVVKHVNNLQLAKDI